MKKHTMLFAAAVGLLTVNQLSAQDKATFKEVPQGYYQSTILKSLDGPGPAGQPPRKSFKVDVSGMNLPTDPASYSQIWHQTPISQGRTNTCWCFATTSFYESEVFRLTGQKVKLSEIYTVYWEYVDRAKYFVQNRGNMFVGEGSETNALAKAWKNHGIVPSDQYKGMASELKFHDHDKMFKEIEAYFKSVKERNAWNETEVVATTRSILDHYLGTPPETVTVGKKTYSPKDYMEKVLKLNMDDYVNFMSLMQEPFFQTAEYKVPDNWWHANNYNNVPIEEFITALKGALKGGYSISIGGDVSEAGLVSDKQVAIVPSFDIPAQNIDDNARQMRFLNGTTTDDHAMHIVGYKEQDGTTWYLVKDSGAGSRNCGETCKGFGYYFMREDYVKLKMLTMTLHKDAVKELLKKIKG